jgi:GDPmannose 4,6-dehydratase
MLQLGNTSIYRDWGWAPEYVEAMYLMLQQDEPEDYVIATGESHSLEEFVVEAFTCAGLNWQDFVVIDTSLLRPTDLVFSRANPTKAGDKLGWHSRLKMPDVARLMVEAKLGSTELSMLD